MCGNASDLCAVVQVDSLELLIIVNDFMDWIVLLWNILKFLSANVTFIV